LISESPRADNYQNQNPTKFNKKPNRNANHRINCFRLKREKINKNQTPIASNKMTLRILAGNGNHRGLIIPGCVLLLILATLPSSRAGRIFGKSWKNTCIYL